MNCDVQFFRFSDYSNSSISTRFSDFSDYMILPIVILFSDSLSYARFSYFSDYTILPIFLILRFFRLYDSSDFSDSPSSMRLSYFSDSMILLSTYSTNLRSKSELEPFKRLFFNMITYNTLCIQRLLYSRFKDYFIFPLAFKRSSISSLCVSITNDMNALNLNSAIRLQMC